MNKNVNVYLSSFTKFIFLFHLVYPLFKNNWIAIKIILTNFVLHENNINLYVVKVKSKPSMSRIERLYYCVKSRQIK